MWLLMFAVLLLVLKLAGFPSQVEELSWWWVAAPFALAFVWFEFIERNLGLDKKKAFDELQKAKQERVKKNMERDKSYRPPR